MSDATLHTWSVYLLGDKRIRLGSIKALSADQAMNMLEKTAFDYQLEPMKLLLMKVNG